MSRTFIRQETQIRNSDTYDDSVTPSLANYETNPTHIESDLNNLRSQIQNILNRNGASFPTGDWYSDMTAPTTFENGIKRGVDKINQELHDLERKRVLVAADQAGSVVTVGGTDDFVILALSELPPNTTAAVGAVTTRGTVAAFHAGTFGTHSLDEVAGSAAVSPKNLCEIWDSGTRDPILSSGRKVYALLQVETNTDGLTLTGSTPNRAQLSFVRLTAAGDDLEAVPAADIQGAIIRYAVSERKALEDLTEQDFLRGATTDVSAAAAATRQVAYNSQGTTPVDLTNNAILDIEGAGLSWKIRDDLEADLFAITEGSAGGTTEIAISSDVDTFRVDAILNDFDQGISVRTGDVQIDLGKSAIASTATIESIGAANDLRLFGSRELFLDDANQAGSTWAQTNGIKLSDTTQEWSDFETAFGGEVSIMRAVYLAYTELARKPKIYANLTTNVSADTDVGGVAGGANLDAQLPDMSVGTFITDYDVFLNGELLRGGVDAAANHDYYPGTSLANGQLKFEFSLKGTGANPDVICVIPYK